MTAAGRAAILEPSLFYSLVNMLNKLWPQDEALDLLKTWVPYGIWLFGFSDFVVISCSFSIKMIFELPSSILTCSRCPLTC
jgi:hypothetical protein